MNLIWAFILKFDILIRECTSNEEKLRYVSTDFPLHGGWCDMVGLCFFLCPSEAFTTPVSLDFMLLILSNGPLLNLGRGEVQLTMLMIEFEFLGECRGIYESQ